MGNSEVGHMNIGAGRIVDQDFTRINKAIQDGSFANNPVLTSAFSKLANNGNALHLFGLLSPGGVHSHEDHFQASINLAHSMGVKNILVHAFLDGRDVPPKSALTSLIQLQQHLEALDCGRIASLCGRFFAMDRDNRWDRIESAYNLISAGRTVLQFDSPEAALQAGYARGETDEFISPSAIVEEGTAASIDNEDQVLFLNFRSDRARQLTRAFVDEEFSGFERTYRPRLADFMTLTCYADDLDTTCVYDSHKLHNSLGEYISNRGLSQLRIAETEKYAHVTFFFSGGREDEFIGESRILKNSPKVATYDLKPEMSAFEITDSLLEELDLGSQDFICLNYANGDMVGHTGSMKAAIKACEAVDKCVEKVVESALKNNYTTILIADHGNCETMINPDGSPNTAHTTNPVPVILIDKKIKKIKNGILGDIAPTILKLMGIDKPTAMTQESLV
jgi:2,3-bisphosphoglycerate-independent phosphoglycerate mutase